MTYSTSAHDYENACPDDFYDAPQLFLCLCCGHEFERDESRKEDEQICPECGEEDWVREISRD